MVSGAVRRSRCQVKVDARFNTRVAAATRDRLLTVAARAVLLFVFGSDISLERSLLLCYLYHVSEQQKSNK
jgi:hypothetical protein